MVLKENEAVEEYGLIFKIDFEKVYDYVNWNFLVLLYLKKALGKTEILDQRLLDTACFSIIINGQLRGRFGTSRV